MKSRKGRALLPSEVSSPPTPVPTPMPRPLLSGVEGLEFEFEFEAAEEPVTAAAARLGSGVVLAALLRLVSIGCALSDTDTPPSGAGLGEAPLVLEAEAALSSREGVETSEMKLDPLFLRFSVFAPDALVAFAEEEGLDETVPAVPPVRLESMLCRLR